MEPWEAELRAKMEEIRKQTMAAEGSPEEVIDLDNLPQADPSYQPVPAPPERENGFERPALPNFGVADAYRKYVPLDYRLGIMEKGMDFGEWVKQRQAAEEATQPLGREADMADRHPMAYLAGKKVVDATGATEKLKKNEADWERREATEAGYKDVATKAAVNEEVARRAIVALKKRADIEKMAKDRDEAGQRYKIERPIYQSEKK